MKEELINKAYEIAKERYAALGLDVEKVMEQLQKVSISMHCWQADDVQGFESAGSLTGGIQTTGNYPGKARNMEELRSDILKAASYIPGKHRLNLHEIYGDFGGTFVDRDQVEVKHFESWMQWAAENGIKWILIPLLSLIRRAVIFLWLIRTKVSVIFGSNILNVVVPLPRKWGAAREIPAS